MKGRWLTTRWDTEEGGPFAPSGMDFHLVMSPYERPEAFRGVRGEHGRPFRIEFRYLDGDEPTQRMVGSASVSFEVGKHSGRLFAIEIDARKLGVSQVTLRLLVEGVEKALQDLPQSNGERANIKATRELLRRNEAALEREFAVAG